MNQRKSNKPSLNKETLDNLGLHKVRGGAEASTAVCECEYWLKSTTKCPDYPHRKQEIR